jgi:hypothetical protein
MREEEHLTDRLARQARDLMTSAGSKTGQLARLGRLQLDLLAIKREIQQGYRQLGERTLELVRSGETEKLADDPIAEPILRRLERLDADRIDREQRILAAKEAGRREESTS